MTVKRAVKAQTVGAVFFGLGKPSTCRSAALPHHGEGC